MGLYPRTMGFPDRNNLSHAMWDLVVVHPIGVFVIGVFELKPWEAVMYLPVVFACMVHGACVFYSFPLEDSKSACEAVVNRALDAGEKDELIAGLSGTCFRIQRA
jgi:hypothetical protein